MRRLAGLLAVVVLAGCGEERTTVAERDLVVGGSGITARRTADRTARAETDPVRIAVITHGQASSSFWAIVRNGVEAAARQTGAIVTYRSPDDFSVPAMVRLIRDAIAARPDGIVVSLPDPAIGVAVRRAAALKIPVVSINSGSDEFRRYGILSHVGQPEARAGEAAGARLAAAGVRRAICVHHERGNAGLDDRCAGFARAMQRRGGSSRVVFINPDAPGSTERVAAVLRDRSIDGALAVGSKGALAAAAAADSLGRADVRLATFDLPPEVLELVRGRRLLFAVDQQAYLQGFLPVVLLAQRARYGLYPAQGEVIPTGPNFVTAENAAQALALSRRSIR